MFTQMNKFYENVITELSIALEEHYKNKNVFKNNQIEQIEKKMRSKMKNPKRYFQKLTDNYFEKRNSYAASHQKQEEQFDKNILQTKKQQISQLPKITNQISSNKQKAQRLKSQDSKKPVIEQDQQDDLYKFKQSKKVQKSLIKIKAQQQKVKQSKIDQQQIDIDFSQSQYLFKRNNQDIKKLKDNVGIHIIGQYNVKQKKFNSKKQETRIPFKNVFIKIENHDTELFFKQIQLTIKKTQKDYLQE